MILSSIKEDFSYAHLAIEKQEMQVCFLFQFPKIDYAQSELIKAERCTNALVNMAIMYSRK